MEESKPLGGFEAGLCTVLMKDKLARKVWVIAKSGSTLAAKHTSELELTHFGRSNE